MYHRFDAMIFSARYFFSAYLRLWPAADVENGGKTGVVWPSKRAYNGCKWGRQARKRQKTDVDLKAKVSLVLGIISPYSCTQAGKLKLSMKFIFSLLSHQVVKEFPGRCIRGRTDYLTFFSE